MESNKELLEYLKKKGYLRAGNVEAAFRKVDRALFVAPSLKRLAFEDAPLPAGSGQTISAPGIVAVMTEALELKAGASVLEIGTGTGYQACILAEVVGKQGRVVTVEAHAGLSRLAEERAEKLGFRNIEFVVGDGSRGFEAKAPFDRIIATAAAPSVPKPLFNQLKEGGRMVLPVGPAISQDLLLVRKINGMQETEFLLKVIFVPLVGEHGFPQT